MSEITWSFYDLPLPQFQAYALRCGELTQISVRTAGKDGTVTLERWEIPRLMEQNRGKLWENIWGKLWGKSSTNVWDFRLLWFFYPEGVNHVEPDTPVQPATFFSRTV